METKYSRTQNWKEQEGPNKLKNLTGFTNAGSTGLNLPRIGLNSVRTPDQSQRASDLKSTNMGVTMDWNHNSSGLNASVVNSKDYYWRQGFSNRKLSQSNKSMDSYRKNLSNRLNCTLMNEKLKEEEDNLKLEKQWVSDVEEWKKFHSGGKNT